MSDDWTEASIPDQSGRLFAVTGANSGLGWNTARALAQHGANVLVGARSEAKANDAVARIQALHPRGSATPWVVDLADLASVAAAADSLTASQVRLDGLVNNAGVMAPPYGRTAQGFELQLGVNHLGHFALTGRLLPLLLATEGSRVVSVSSLAHRNGSIDFDDLQSERSYSPHVAYGQSKLANLLFIRELQRRLAVTNAPTTALAAHPGVSLTNLFHPPGVLRGMLFSVTKPVMGLFLQSAAKGALPLLRASTDPEAVGGAYYGPRGIKETRGTPVVVGVAEQAADDHVAAQLWTVSETLTEVSFPV